VDLAAGETALATDLPAAHLVVKSVTIKMPAAATETAAAEAEVQVYANGAARAAGGQPAESLPVRLEVPADDWAVIEGLVFDALKAADPTFIRAVPVEDTVPARPAPAPEVPESP